MKNYSLNGVSNDVQIGGNRIISKDGSFGIFESDGATLGNLRLKDGIEDQDAISYKQFITALTDQLSRLSTGLVYKGVFDASLGILPSPTQIGDMWKVSVAGIIDGTTYNIGDMIIANADSGIDKIDNSPPADVLTASDLL
jgi:hypothetical protein